MQRVGIKEFKDNATKLIAAQRTLVIEKRGEPVGVFVPLPKINPRKKAEAVRRMEETVEALCRRTGKTEDELAKYFEWD